MNRSIPGRPAWLFSILFSLASVALGMVVIFHLADRQVHAERAARLQAEQLAEQQAAVNRNAICVVITAQIAVYEGNPPITDTGKSAATAWHDLGALFHCTTD